LAEQAQELLSDLSSRADSGFVFPARFVRRSTNGPRPVSGFGRAKERLDILMAEELGKVTSVEGDDPDAINLVPWRLHDLRRTAASGMARLGMPIHVVEKLLNHISGSISGVAAIYNRHSYQNEMREAAQAWANRLDELLEDRSRDLR